VRPTLRHRRGDIENELIFWTKQDVERSSPKACRRRGSGFIRILCEVSATIRENSDEVEVVNPGVSLRAKKLDDSLNITVIVVKRTVLNAVQALRYNQQDLGCVPRVLEKAD